MEKTHTQKDSSQMAKDTASRTAAGITIKTAPHGANVWPRSYYGEAATDKKTLLEGSYREQSLECKEFLQSFL